jgi:hypothetical protein
MNRWRVGDDRGSKDTDGCPLTLTPLTPQSLQKELPNSSSKKSGDTMDSPG